MQCLNRSILLHDTTFEQNEKKKKTFLYSFIEEPRETRRVCVDGGEVDISVCQWRRGTVQWIVCIGKCSS